LGGLVNGGGGCGSGIPKQPLRQNAIMRGNNTNPVIDTANMSPMIMNTSIVWDVHAKDLLH
jgi:hypothetical protein